VSAPAFPIAAPRSQPRGWWGMVLFVATEATLFGVLLGSYATLRFGAAHWPPPGVEEPRVLVPLLVTALLVASSWPMALASGAAGAGRVGEVRGALLAALAVQAAYFGLQTHLFLGDLDHFTPQGSAYGSIYFTLAGAHLAHVGLGLLLDLWLLLRVADGLTPYRVVGVRATAFYWHAVNVLAVVVTLVLVSPSL
jgi:cytochrome c oxidase subunit III